MESKLFDLANEGKKKIMLHQMNNQREIRLCRETYYIIQNII